MIQQGGDIGGHIGEQVRGPNCFALAEAAQVGQDQVKVIFEQRHNRFPDGVVERVTVNQHQRRTIPPTLVSNFNPIYICFQHFHFTCTFCLLPNLVK